MRKRFHLIKKLRRFKLIKCRRSLRVSIIRLNRKKYIKHYKMVHKKRRLHKLVHFKRYKCHGAKAYLQKLTIKKNNMRRKMILKKKKKII